MALSKKQFIEFADLIAKHNPTKAMVDDITYIMASSNNRFDKHRFADRINSQSNKRLDGLNINDLQEAWGVK
jgi:hypothetical protein|tara:strand:- start:474 stop:689 length:216 start_codon:yes stop_codon:yes gene_type:complete